jgi:hypothetical protein
VPRFAFVAFVNGLKQNRNFTRHSFGGAGIALGFHFSVTPANQFRK